MQKLCTNPVLKDVQLLSTALPCADNKLDLGPDLEFLSIVEVSRIPLCLTAGPALDVCTGSERTEQWFNDVLLSTVREAGEDHDEWWRDQLQQSSLGVLARVTEKSTSTRGKCRITEILFYGVVDGARNRTSPPTPLPSSSHSKSNSTDKRSANESTIRVQAIPLSSEILDHLPTPPESPANSADAHFLPSIEELKSAAEEKERKRKRVADVFDEATDARSKARRKGGEAVAAAASRINTLVGQKKSKEQKKGKDSPLELKTGPAKANERVVGSQYSRSTLDKTTSELRSPIEGPSRRPHSRSPSISSESRPLSRKGTLESSKRSSLSQIISVSEASTVENRNKEAISRFVMAGMRLYGLQQRKKPSHSRRESQNISTALVPPSSEDVANDEEYKLIYHQTYKGVVFAFVGFNFLLHIKPALILNLLQRKHIATKPLHLTTEPLQETVDRFLAIFCADPFTSE
jgi:hypothetical protein